MRKILVFFVVLFAVSFAFTQDKAQQQKIQQEKAQQEKTQGKSSEANKTQAKLPTVKEVLNKYVEAIGGRKAYEKIKGLKTKGTVEFLPMGIKGEYESYSVAPNKLFAKTTLQGVGEIIEVFDGQRGWSVDPFTGKRELKDIELAQASAEAFFYKDLHLDKLYPDMQVKGIEKVGDREAYVLVGRLSKDADETKFYFDTQTGFLIREESSLMSPQGKLQTVTLFEDMREIGGIKVPYKITAKTPLFQVVTTVTSVEINPQIDEKIFSEPK